MRAELLFFVVTLSLALLTMIAYRLTPQGRGSQRDLQGRGGSFALGFWVRDWFYWFIRPLKWLSLTLGLSPYVFNGLGVLLALASGAAFARGHLATGGWMILLSGIADVMDGEIARAKQVVSKGGAFLDSTLDRYAEIAIFAGLALHYGSHATLWVVLALGGSLLVSYTRARGESLGVLCKLGFMQRAERMLMLGLGSILGPSLGAWLGRDPGDVLFVLIVFIAVSTLGTAIFRTGWILRRLGED